AFLGRPSTQLISRRHIVAGHAQRPSPGCGRPGGTGAFEAGISRATRVPSRESQRIRADTPGGQDPSSSATTPQVLERPPIMKRSQLVMAGMACLVSTASAAEPDVGEGAAKIPLSEVVLYTSGVGYFQRDGQVEQNAQIELRFKTEDINDLLKSLVVQDFDG